MNGQGIGRDEARGFAPAGEERQRMAVLCLSGHLTRLTAVSALKSLAVLLCPTWQPITGIPACRKLGH